MATTLPHSLVSSPRSSELLRSSSHGLQGVQLQTLGMKRLGSNVSKRDFAVAAAIKRKGKVKRHDYPWPKDPKDIDPNIKGGVLRYLSDFKPLKEKPKPVTLEFERPLIELEKKILDVKKMAQETGLDFTDQIASLQKKYDQALKDLYTHLTPIQRVYIARHPNRPTTLDHIFEITERFVELHGDRAGYDDPAIVTGIGTIDGRSYMFIGHQKGRNTKEHIKRNFGMPTPHGYRKALRMMNYAEHHGFPIITFVDTPGAFADLKSEELGQGEAIAYNLRHMFGLKVPVVSVVIGEGGSGGALAIACANKLLMLENAVFFVASPEACAAILWKTNKAAPKAAKKLKITATELCKLQIADGIIPEPLGGAHVDPTWTSQQIKLAVTEAMDELLKMDTEELLTHRYQKFRKVSAVQEGIPLDPAKKVNMKLRDRPLITKTKNADVKVVVKAPPQPKIESLSSRINRLKRETSQEFAEAVKAMGMSEKVEAFRDEVLKASRSSPIDPATTEKIRNLRREIEQEVSKAPNFSSLNKKAAELKELSRQKGTTAAKPASSTTKEAMNKSDLKNKLEEMELLKLKASRGEIPAEEFKSKLLELNQQIKQWIADSPALREKVDKIKMKLEEQKRSPGGSNGSLKSEPTANIEAQTDLDASPVKAYTDAN